MKVLLAFSVETTTLGFAGLRARTDLPMATLYRLLADLVWARLLERVDGKYRCRGWPAAPRCSRMRSFAASLAICAALAVASQQPGA